MLPFLIFPYLLQDTEKIVLYVGDENMWMLSIKRIIYKNIVLQRKNPHCLLKSIPLFHPFKSTALYLSSVKVHFSGSDKKWSSPSCSSNSLACGGLMFSIWSMEWDAIQSTREKSAEKLIYIWQHIIILYYIHLLITLHKTD